MGPAPYQRPAHRRSGGRGHLWAESFDRRLTVENILHIQGELAARIASALDATLTPSELVEGDAAPTENMEAYTLYQRANTYFNVSPRAQDFQPAFDLFAQAMDLDPGFAQAYARHALARARAFEVRPGLGGRGAGRIPRPRGPNTAASRP